jgi:hypothetical protein
MPISQAFHIPQVDRSQPNCRSHFRDAESLERKMRVSGKISSPELQGKNQEAAYLNEISGFSW